MTLPASGQISINEIRIEEGESGGDYSLTALSTAPKLNTLASPRPDGLVPHAMSEFYSYNHLTSLTPTPTPTITPTVGGASPSVTPTVTPSITITSGASPSITPTITPSPTQTPALVSPSATPSVTPSISVSSIPDESPSVTPTITPSITPSITPTITPSITISITPSETPPTTPSPTPTPSPGIGDCYSLVESGGGSGDISWTDINNNPHSGVTIAAGLTRYLCVKSGTTPVETPAADVIITQLGTSTCNSVDTALQTDPCSF